MTEQMTEQEVAVAAPDWYSTWRGRIYEWVRHNTDDDMARVIMLVPDMFMLLVRLMKDQRVPFLLKGQLVLAATYVLSPFDFVPEGLLGPIGLAEDAGVMALVLLGIKRIASLPPGLLSEHWSGSEDPQDVIESVHKKVMTNLNGDIWQKIVNKFGEQASRRWFKRGDRRQAKQRVQIS